MRLLDEALIHLVYGTAADDDLELSAAGKLAFHQIQLEDLFHICLALVF